ncbi:DNA polymerase I [Crassaminicella thermophila]|uniref:DNA polymerase I n=1 Tax=Crassaminicella thermophila TaxID=2599308 RepID=A0A5C0SGH5_CRATE|nr:DNA polymerase I [Crassaminicella thermophila]QEK12328.1 DNA polymerase I [Crassaminicella thermophila]
MEDKKIIIIDGNSLINRTFYALPQLTTKDGIHTNAIYGFVNVLYKIFEDYKPDYITVAFDKKAPTFRHKAFDEYKAGRKKMPPELAEQLPILKEVLDAYRIHRVEIDGFEADDLIGTIVKFCEKQNIRPIVITGDKDALQLASDKTKVLITKKGISELEEYDEKGVFEKYGVTPKQFIDLKGLMGDKSDNIPGVPGIGEKTGTKLIKEFNSIENLLSNIDKVSSIKLRNKLEEYAQQAVLSKKLATIMVDVPVEMSLEEFEMKEPDTDKLLEIFNRLEFRKLMNKLQINNKDLIKQKNNIKTNVIHSIEEIKQLKQMIKNNKEIYFKIFSDGKDVRNDMIIGIHMLIDDESYFIHIQNCKEMVDVLKDIFEDMNIKKYGHQLKKDILALKRYNIFLKGISFDSAIALYLIEPTRKSYDIYDIAYEYLNENILREDDILGKGKKRISFYEVPIEKLIEYGFCVCSSVKNIKEIFEQKLKEYDLEKLYYEVELPLVEVLADMEFQGFMIDKEKLKKLGEVLDEKINNLTSQIFSEAKEEFNINSTKQLGEILFDKLGLPPIKKTKTGYSTNIEVLQKLYDKHNIIPKIIEYRQMVKLKSTYIDGLIAVINHTTNKIHSSFNQTVTSTGRISSTEPNLQNIPIKLDIGREIRKVFVPTNEEYLLLDADYSQIELRVLAHISCDPNLMEAFHEGLDIHTATASKVFDVSIDEVTSIQRSRAKAVNFGIIYGISDYGLSENLHITKKEAQKYIDEYFDKYKGVKKYMDNVIIEGKEKGYVKTILNRRRYIPELKSKNYNLRSFGERTAMNTPIQGSAADIIKIAMVKVYQELTSRNLKSKLILQVHDELIVEVHKDELEEVKDIVKTEMENALKLDVPLKVDMKIGKDWYETK